MVSVFSRTSPSPRPPPGTAAGSRRAGAARCGGRLALVMSQELLTL